VPAHAVSGAPSDLRGHAEADGILEFDTRVVEHPSQPLYVACHDDLPAQPALDVTSLLAELPTGQ
jgi:hypothetical protein